MTKAQSKLVRRCSDAELLLNAIICGVARFEWLGDREVSRGGEVCVDGLRHYCPVVDGAIELTVHARLALRRVTPDWLTR